MFPTKLVQTLLRYWTIHAVLGWAFAQQSCTDQGIANCQASNRLCFLDETSNESCQSCIDGYVELTGKCIPVGSLTIREFFSEFNPFYQGSSNSNLGQRQSSLQSMASFISAHNSQSSQPKFWLVLNKFAADTVDEIKERLGLLPSDSTSSNLDPVPTDPSVAVTETSVDWVKAGAVTSVKDQGRCGCCWAVAVAGAIEGAAAVSSNFSYLQSISFQQFISCDTNNLGCDGGNPAVALNYADKNSFGGLTRLNDYPFTDATGATTQTCKLDSGGYPIAVTTTGAGYVVSTDTSDSFTDRVSKMKQVLLRQPIVISMRAYCNTITAYGGGIITDDGDCACSDSTCLDHAVLLVGFNDEVSDPYWLVKNSWGTDWGEGGYFRVAQANPTNSPYGLFALMAEGVVPTNASNSTGQVNDQPQTVNKFVLDSWMIGLIAAAGAVILGLMCLGCCCGSRGK
jgi:hypothetical protein